MKKIDLREHQRDPKYYNRDHDMETALAWNAVKKTLTELGRSDLYEYIESIKVTEKNIIITTHRPIVNAEMRQYSHKLRDTLRHTLRIMSGDYQKWTLRIR